MLTGGYPQHYALRFVIRWLTRGYAIVIDGSRIGADTTLALIAVILITARKNEDKPGYAYSSLSTIVMDKQEKIVLIVEKDTGIANMIRAILGIVNVPVKHTQQGSDAVFALKENNTGLIICEKQMPDMTGYDLLTFARNNPATANVPFIMLVDEDDKSYEKLKPEQRADRYITKPFTARKVLDVVKEFIVYKGL